MEQILERLLTRPGLQTAQMAGAAVRNALGRDVRATLAGLAAWSEHPNPFVRIASGVGYGVIGVRDRNTLSDLLPYVERLANDAEPTVREHGAQAALEQIWMAHPDAMSNVVEGWIVDKNDNVREVVVRTISRIATGGQIMRPTLLRRFIERGISIYDRLVPEASPQVRGALAECLDEIGCLAPELVMPFVREWAAREDAGALRLVIDLSRLPFGASCEGYDLDAVAQRLKGIEAQVRTRAAQWVRAGQGQVDYLPLFATELLARTKHDDVPWTHVADPYRGCQLRCEFCNARSLSEWIGDDPDAFLRRVSIVRNAPEVLMRELQDPKVQPREENVILIGGDSDPYQPAEERFELTRDLLKQCLQAEHPVILQTRQELVLRDLDVLELLAEKDLVNVLVAMQTPIEGIRNKVELGTATVSERYRTIRMLSTKNVPVGLVLSPIMPELTDDEGIIDEVVRRAADAGAKWVVAQVLDLRGSAGVKVRLFLENYIATLLPRYEEIYTHGEGREADPEYIRRITEELVPAIAARHKANDTSRMLTSGRDPARMLVRR